MRLLFACLALAMSPTTANAEFYVSAFGGANYPTVETNFAAPPVTGSAVDAPDSDALVKDALSVGYLYGGAVGYRFNAPMPGHIRIEFEGSRRKTTSGMFFNFDGPLDTNGVAIFIPNELFAKQRGDRLQSTSAMANVLYETPRLGQKISFYAGGGAGVAWIDQNARIAESVEVADAVLIGVVNDTEFEASVFQWQAIAGVSATVTPDIELFVEGRYSRTGRAEDPDAIGFSPLTGPGILRASQSSALAGLRFSFN